MCIVWTSLQESKSFKSVQMNLSYLKVDIINYPCNKIYTTSYVCMCYFISLLHFSVHLAAYVHHFWCCLQSAGCTRRCGQSRSHRWMRAHPPEPGTAHGQVVNKWKWKIAATCWAHSSTCRRERRAGHDGCPVSPLLLIWSKIYRPKPPTLQPPHNRQTDVRRSLTSTWNCLCAKLPLGWEMLFIRCTSPIVFLIPSGLLGFFVIKIPGILTCFSVNQLNRDMNGASEHAVAANDKTYCFLWSHLPFRTAENIAINRG